MAGKREIVESCVESWLEVLARVLGSSPGWVYRHPQKAGFSALQMVHSPKVFGLSINLISSKFPKVYCGKQSLFLLPCDIGTCSKKIQSEIIIQIRTLLLATFKSSVASAEKADESFSWIVKEKQDTLA